MRSKRPFICLFISAEKEDFPQHLFLLCAKRVQLFPDFWQGEVIADGDPSFSASLLHSVPVPLPQGHHPPQR